MLSYETVRRGEGRKWKDRTTDARSGAFILPVDDGVVDVVQGAPRAMNGTYSACASCGSQRRALIGRFVASTLAHLATQQDVSRHICAPFR